MKTDSYDEKEEGYVKLIYAPRWKYANVVRTFIQSFLSVSVIDPEKANKVAIAASELVENSVKYSSNDETKLTMFIEKRNKYISVTVENSACPEQIEYMEKFLAELKSGDPLKTYLSKMQNAIIRNDGKSQLGLARIQYETGADLDFTVNDTTVCVIATFKLDNEV